MTIGVSHVPPGTSTWNKIEHRMFCHITENWRGRPLVDRQTVWSGNDPSLAPDGAISPGNYQCNGNWTSTEPEQCDGLANSITYGAAPADKGCGSDENHCDLGDSDPAPVRYSSGRVESNPITAFRVATPGDFFFGYLLKYNSDVVRTPAQRNTVNGMHDDHPVIHHPEEDTHFIGLGWLDNFSDRLYIKPYDAVTRAPSPYVTWTSQNGTVTFINTNGSWRSWSGRYELLDRGPSPADGLGRWVVRTVDTAAPRQVWAFEEISYTPYENTPVQQLGRLRRHEVLTANLDDLQGRYGFSMTWNIDGTIASAIDTLGREFDFDYHPEQECVLRDPDIQPPADSCVRYETISLRLEAVRYRPNPQAVSTVVVALTTTALPHNDRLERIERPGLPGYTRFLYIQSPSKAGS